MASKDSGAMALTASFSSLGSGAVSLTVSKLSELFSRLSKYSLPPC